MVTAGRTSATGVSRERAVDLIREVGERIQPDDRGLEPWFHRYRQEHADRLATDLELIAQRVPGQATILEYGAVPLLMTAALSTMGYQVIGLDIAPARFSQARARLGLDVRRCDVETEPTPFEDSSFDVVLFNELFEHLRINPIFTMREVSRVLKRGGTLLLSTPNLRSFRGLRNLLVHNRGHASSAGVYRQFEKLEALGHMGHVREYTTREVTEFLTRVGFSIDTVLFRGGHGAGLVGLAERLAPGLRPFFTVIATRPPETTGPRSTQA